MLSTFASQAQFGGHSKVLFAYFLLFLLPLFAALLRVKPSYPPVFIGFLEGVISLSLVELAGAFPGSSSGLRSHCSQVTYLSNLQVLTPTLALASKWQRQQFGWPSQSEQGPGHPPLSPLSHTVPGT